MKNIMLQTTKLSKTYQQQKAVNDINMTIEKGDIYGFIGKNGAGKTTYIRLITGLIEKTDGKIFIDNKKDYGNIGAVIEGPVCYPYLSAEENLNYFAIQQGVKDKKRVEEVLKFVGLEETGKKKFKDFSMGMRQRLGIGVAILSKPKFIVLDEPINGLDPEGIIEIRNIILRLNQEMQTTILISSHILSELSMVATRYGVINAGQLIAEFTAEELERESQHKIHLDTSDNLMSYQVLSEEYEVTQAEEKLTILANKEDQESIGEKLLQASIAVKEMYSDSTNLEDYYLELTGGINHV